MRSLRLLMSLSVLLVSMLLASSALAIEVGEEAPDFTLPSTTGEKISLSQFKGLKHVLIQFYSMDFNPVCTANLTIRMVDHSKFDALNVQLLAISANNPVSHQMFAALELAQTDLFPCGARQREVRRLLPNFYGYGHLGK